MTLRAARSSIVRLYDTFFATAFKKTVDKLGIVYTPVEIVDFILNSADEVLRKEFGQGLTDEGVHILDGFTGTGTFMVRLLESGLIKPHDMARKYGEELHANEILLLAYYIAAVNIETTYLGLRRDGEPDADYESFPGLILTDTFQSWEDDDRQDLEVFPENNERLERLKKLPITVIVGNPPYSVGQESANDNNQNEKYPSLDEAIRGSYAERSAATNKNSLYNSYIRAIKWASLRLTERGVIAFVTANGFLDSNSADGLRQVLAEEFTSIHVFDLKGNQKGDWRREGGKVFGEGSQSGIAITLLVRNPANTDPVRIHYTDVGDYLTTDQKLERVSSAGSLGGLGAVVDISPNQHGDWLNQRRDDFETFLWIGDKQGEPSIFGLYSGGLKTNRDAWCYSFEGASLRANMQRLIATYEADRQAGRISKNATSDESLISWNRGLLADLDRGKVRTYAPDAVRRSAYRPFTKQHVYFDRALNDMVYRLNDVYPTPTAANLGIVAMGPRSEALPAVLAADAIPDVATFVYTTQFFPRWRYQAVEDAGMFDLTASDEELVDGFRRIDNITDEALKRFKATYGTPITKDDIFYYVYGLLHSPEYRETYAADLKKDVAAHPARRGPVAVRGGWP